MRWKGSALSVNMITRTIMIITLVAIGASEAVRRTPVRRQDTELYSPAPSVESLQEIAEAMGAAGFEHYTEGKVLVKRLIPSDSQPDLDVVEHQGVIGKAGLDFPAYPNIPSTGFNCKNVPTGYYADLETDCQVFHICDTSRKISFLCPNGTIFSQSHLICDWWFKVDCASAPALYESSAEYYSNEQKKSKKISQSLSKVQDLQQIGADTNVRAESRRPPAIPSTTERLYRGRQRQTEFPKATAKTYQALFADNFSPTQRTAATTAFENRRKSLVQLITNNGGIQSRSTLPTYTAAPVYRTTPDYNVREMQVAAESASFVNNNNRQFLQDYHSKGYRQYPVYTPNVPQPKPKSNPNLTTLYNIRDTYSSKAPETTTTKRPTLLPYTKGYTSIVEKQEPYTRPGVSLLRGFLQKAKNRTSTTTEKSFQATDRSSQFDKLNRVTIETKDTFESVTRIPQTTRSDTYYPDTSDKHETFSTYQGSPTTEINSSYQERRERLLKKITPDNFGPTEPTVSITSTEKKYLDNRSGLGVPSSVASMDPKTLHSLAIYYATALDNLSTTPTPEDLETSTPNFDEYEEGLPALFSPHTVNKYSSLFGQQKPNSELLEEIREDPNGTYNELAEDLAVMQSQNGLAASPQIRELAQVFTHALSAYLQDPVQFRKVLSDIRPTHPSFGDLLTTTEESINTEPTTTVNEEDEILGFSDDNKADLISGAREPKALEVSAKYQEEITTTERPIEISSTTYRPTTPRNPFKCCGKISASYIRPITTVAPSNKVYTVAANVNTLANNYSDALTTTESDYSVHKYGGFQNNALTLHDPYGKELTGTEGKPVSDYIGVTNLPTAWGVDSGPTTASDFESKRIKTSTFIPTTTTAYFTDTESIEIDNEEELQRAHSQSFAAPQGNSIRQGKQLNLEINAKRPAKDLEAPTVSEVDTATVQTTIQPTTIKYTDIELTTPTPTAPESYYFTSPDSYKTTNLFAWSNSFGNWHSTVIDPITLNDGLSPTAPDETPELMEHTYIPTTSTTPDYSVTEQTASSTINVEITTHNGSPGERVGRLLKDPTSTEPAQDLTTITDTVVEKAKEMMNATTTEKLMNVMKKTKSKTVKRLILLLIQTCDDDHNTTAEASKKALLEALMAVSQKDMEDIAKEENVAEVTTENERTTTIHRRTGRIDRQRGERRGKSLNSEPNAVNSLTSTSDTVKSTEGETSTSTTLNPLKASTTTRRGIKKFIVRTTPAEVQATNVPPVESPTAEARVAGLEDLKTASDTRALELLRSLYSIAARWG